MNYVDAFARNISEYVYRSVHGDEHVYTLKYSSLKVENNAYCNNVALSITKDSRPANIIVVSLKTTADAKVLSPFFLQDTTVFQIVYGRGSKPVLRGALRAPRALPRSSAAVYVYWW